MFTNSNHVISSSTRFVRCAGLAACALLAAACHGGLDTPTGPSASTEVVLSATSGDESVEAASAERRMTHDMAEANSSGHSGTCTLAAARGGFRLKAQGQGTPESLVYFHLIRADGFRTTAIVEVSRQGTFRTGQELVTYFPPNAEVRCALQTPGGALLAGSTTFIAP